MNQRLDAVTISQLYQTNKSNPVIQLETSLDKIKNTSHTYIEICQARAMREAIAAKSRWDAGQPLSLFDGVPISWKDLFDIQGYRTTAASAVYKNVPLKTTDADIVAKLTQVGIVSVGKTNLSEFAYSGLGLNPHYGTPKNVYNPARISGGSSSGAAVSVGLDTVPIGMGSDTAGSIRIPAAFNGLVGYRSSHSRYSKVGIYELSKTLDTLGPLANSVRDCIILDDLILGKKVFEIPEIDNRSNSFNFIVDEHILNHPDIADSVKLNFLSSIEKLQQKGYHIEYKTIEAFQRVLDLVDSGLWLGAAEAFVTHQNLLDSPQAELIDQRIRKRLERSRDFPASLQIKLYFLQQQLIRELQQQLQGRLLLTPTVMHTAPKLQPIEENEDVFFDTNMRTLRLTMPGSFLDMPAVTLPNGFDDNNLPTALLLSSFSGDDQKVLQASYAIEKVI